MGSGTGLVGGFCLLWLAILLTIPFILMLAWNAVAPVFGGPQIDFITAFAGYIVLRIIGGALRGGRK